MVHPRRRDCQSRADHTLTPLRAGPVSRSAVGAALLIAVVPVGTAACSTGPADKGTVYGTMFISGGPPAPGVNPNKLHAMKDFTVTATSANGEKFDSTTSRAGTFSLNLPPGTYTLKSRCGASSPPRVVVNSGERVKRNVYCVAS